MKITKNKIKYISFMPKKNEYTALLSLEDLLSSTNDLENILKEMTQIYCSAINDMKKVIREIERKRKKRALIPAKTVWKFGDLVLKLSIDLEKNNFRIDSLYGHLERDLKVKRSWLNKVIIFRRYIPEISAIPKDLNWGKCSKKPREIANNLVKDWIKNKL